MRHVVALLAAAAAVAGMTDPIDVPCPDALRQRGACYGDEWGGGELPKEEGLAYVQDMLQSAIEVEHSTIPLYLATMYSIKNQSSFPAKTMRSVVMEEMLHMTSASNILNAIGGKPLIDYPGFIPKYPLVMPLINITADLVWFTGQAVKHYKIVESFPAGGANNSIAACYLRVMDLLEALCQQHGEKAIFTGNHSLQVEGTTSYGQKAQKVFSLQDAKNTLMGVAEQGAGCPVDGHAYPETVNISAGPLGGEISHAERFTEIIVGQAYRDNDTVGHPTGPKHDIDWVNVRKFVPNPSVDDFLPSQCKEGGKWVVRDSSFFVEQMWLIHNKHLASKVVATADDCARWCVSWTLNASQPLAPCAMWSWKKEHGPYDQDIPLNTCLLAQGGGPTTEAAEGFVSGCQFGTVCNGSLPMNGPAASAGPVNVDPDPDLLKKCSTIHQRGVEFASNYTALLVSMHNTFNGQPALLDSTIGQMFTLKKLAIDLMNTPDPRLEGMGSGLGVGPPWEYVPAASEFEARKRSNKPQQP